MSVSSGSDVTIPIQDSPPPPPSPYGNRAQLSSMDSNNSSSERKTPEPRGDVGVDNVGYELTDGDESPDSNKSKRGKKVVVVNGKGSPQQQQPKVHEQASKGSSKKAEHTQIQMNGQEPPPLLNEALNSELINMNIMNTIPDKPQPEFGPYENPDEYFIAVNQHKKFLRRSEKLYVTKDKRKVNSWKKYVCWLMGAFILASIVTIAVLAGLGLISQKSQSSFGTESVLGTTSPSELISSSSTNPLLLASSSELPVSDIFEASSSTTSSTEHSPAPPVTRPPLSDNHVPSAADVSLTLDNAEYTAALNNKSSARFHELAAEIEQETRRALTLNAGLSSAYAKVMEFLPGSIVVKMRLSWMDERKDLMDVQMFMSSLRTLGQYDIRAGATTSYALVNHCKFGNYRCSHYCTFDYEQLDFLCTCPELLRLAEDKKTCTEDAQFSSTSSNVLSSGTKGAEVEDEPETTAVPELQEGQQEPAGAVSEPGVEQEQVPESNQEGTVQEHAAATDPESGNNRSTTTSEAPLVQETQVENGDSPSEGPGGASVPEVTMETTDEAESAQSPSAQEGQAQAEDAPAGGEQGGTTSTETEQEAAAHKETPSIIIPILTTTAAPEPVSIDAPGESTIIEGRDDGIETTIAPMTQQQDDEDLNASPTEIPDISPSSSAANTSEEESSIGAPLQRTESDNYSEVEKHQRISTDTINTTTSGPPIVSFNSSRYSEERNVSSTLSDESSLSNESHLAAPAPSSSNNDTHNQGEVVSSEAETIVPANSTATRTKTARFETFGEEPVPATNNASARHLISNSAEFMVYGDNVVNSHPTQKQTGTDSGLVDNQTGHQRRSDLGPLALNNTESSGEQTTEPTQAADNNGSGSVEVISSESEAAKDDSASVSQERTGINILPGAAAVRDTEGSSESPREIEEYTTPMPVNLENDTLVNENATEDKSNVEPVVIEGNAREEEVSITTTPFTPEEPSQDDPEPTVAPVVISREGTSNNNSSVPGAVVVETEVQSEPEIVPTTLAPTIIEETTIVTASAETTSTTTTTTVAPPTSSPATSTTTTTTAGPAAEVRSEEQVQSQDTPQLNNESSTSSTTTTTTTPSPENIPAPSLPDPNSNQLNGNSAVVSPDDSSLNNSRNSSSSSNNSVDNENELS